MADTVVFAVGGDQLHVLLVRRANAPFAGAWALPGGFVEPGESPEDAARRELLEETGVTVRALDQIGAYGDPGRDPRGPTLSVVHRGLLPELVDVQAGTDAAAAAFLPVRQALARNTELAFDHRRILSDAVDGLRADIEQCSIATALCPPRFTLSQLRRVYEAVWGHVIDAPNFRRKVLMTEGYVVPLGRTAAPGPDGGKPAHLYRAGKRVTLTPPLYRHSAH